MLDVMRQEVDDLLAHHRLVEDYPWPVVAELSIDEDVGELTVDFDARLAEYTVPDDTGICHYVNGTLTAVLEKMDAAAAVRCLFGGREEGF